MLSLRRPSLIAVSLLLTVFIAACGGTSNSGGYSTHANATTGNSTNQQANTQMNGQNNNQINVPQTGQNGQSKEQMNGQKSDHNKQGSGQVNNQGQPPVGNANTVIRSAQVTINGQTMTILTNADGKTLYYRTSDPAPNSSCTGACAQNWPPATTQGMIISAAQFQGTLSTHMTANGRQIEYNGHPLYTYAGDTTPGQVNGAGAGNVWQPITVVQQKQHW